MGWLVKTDVLQRMLQVRVSYDSPAFFYLDILTKHGKVRNRP